MSFKLYLNILFEIRGEKNEKEKKNGIHSYFLISIKHIFLGIHKLSHARRLIIVYALNRNSCPHFIDCWMIPVGHPHGPLTSYAILSWPLTCQCAAT